MDIVALGLVIMLVIGMLMLIRGIKTKNIWLIVISIVPLGFVIIEFIIQIIMLLSLTLSPSFYLL